MSYVKDMLDRENWNTTDISEEILNNKNIQKIVLRANKHLDRETILSLRGTKALVLEDMSNTDEEYDNRESWGELLLSAHDRPMGVKVTTWSSLVRNAIDIIRPQIDYAKTIVNAEEFISYFDDCVQSICGDSGITLNMNCPKRLFREAEETDLIKSTVYMNNKNHFIPILTDEKGIVWGLCAVYTGEIIIMLEALLDAIYEIFKDYRPDDISKYPHHTMVLTYIHRDYLGDDKHVIVPNIELADGAELHRFNNACGVPYSAIYLNGDEQMSCEFNSEVDMIKCWNRQKGLYTKLDDVDEEIKKLNMAKDLILLQSKVSKLSTALLEIYADINDIQEKYNLPTADEILKSAE